MTEDRAVLTRAAAPPDLALGHGEVWLADTADRPLVVLIHGGFWRPEFDRRHLRPMGAALRSAGWTVFSVEYRRIPGSPDVTVGDIHNALAAAKAFAGRRGVVVVGHSAGGHLALSAAAGAEPMAVLALAPIADLRLAHRLRLDSDAVSAFLGVPTDRADLDPTRLVAAPGPVVLVHGVDDAIVPIEVSQSYATAHSSVRLVEVPAGHFALIDPLSTVWSTVVDELTVLSRADSGIGA